MYLPLWAIDLLPLNALYGSLSTLSEANDKPETVPLFTRQFTNTVGKCCCSSVSPGGTCKVPSNWIGRRMCGEKADKERERESEKMRRGQFYNVLDSRQTDRQTDRQ